MEHYLSILENTIKRKWESVAVSNFGGEQFRFCDLAINIEKFHIFFKEAGIKKGDKIALCAKNSARWAVSFFAINTYEAVVVPLLSEFTPESASSLIHHSESRILFTDPEMWAKMDQSTMPLLKAVINANDFTLLYSSSDKIQTSFNELPEAFSKKFPMGYTAQNLHFPTDNVQDICVINYTSGTTSAPKGVMLRYECFNAMMEFGIPRMPVKDDDAIVSMLPMGHIYGLTFELIFPICLGGQVVYLGKTPSPTLLLKAMKEVKPFMVVTVPLVMEKIYNNAVKPVVSKWYMKVLLLIPGISQFIYRKIGKKIKAAFGGKCNEFIMGGAALNPTVEKAFRKMGLPYTVGYGMTEASPLLAYAGWREYVPGSCGKPVTSTELRIDSEDPEHIAGEILARGANICSGYFNNPEASANAFTEDGFLRTGDLGIMDAKGNVFIKGRSKNMILSANGQNIYPEELEAVINSQDYVAESVVVDRNGKLVGLVYLDQDAIRKAKLDEEAVADIPSNVLTNSNRVFPAYSKLAKIEIVTEPFEKTPKMSIRRFLYK